MALRMSDLTVNGVEVLNIEGGIVVRYEGNSTRATGKRLMDAG